MAEHVKNYLLQPLTRLLLLPPWTLLPKVVQDNTQEFAKISLQRLSPILVILLCTGVM